MSKYSPLEEFLKAQHTSEVPMSFAEIERIIDAKLPMSALQYQAWWSNNPSNNVMTKVWLAAGYESTQVDMSARKLVFRRVKQTQPDAASQSKNSRRHPLFGAMKGLIHVPDGVDLTEPADPEWGKVYD